MKLLFTTFLALVSLVLISQTSEIIWMETEYNDKKILVNSNTKVPIDGIVFFNPISMNCPDGKNIGFAMPLFDTKKFYVMDGELKMELNIGNYQIVGVKTGEKMVFFVN